MAYYKRIIPGTYGMTPEQEAVWAGEELPLLYHMTTTDRWMHCNEIYLAFRGYLEFEGIKSPLSEFADFYDGLQKLVQVGFLRKASDVVAVEDLESLTKSLQRVIWSGS